ncbi:MAG: hypothetical protein Q8J90_01880 [Gallionella sp.]|nr:hypothetical protein [Gallionella sp.]
MRASNKLLVLSLVVLYGCQPETSAQPPVAPATAEQVMQPAASETAAEEEMPQPTVAETPEQPASVVAEVKPEEMPPVSEADAMQLAKKNNCFACHAVGKKVVGPSFKDIAAKYRGDPEAEALMMDRIAKGGSGVWGVMVMPPTPKASETDRRILAKLVLSSK